MRLRNVKGAGEKIAGSSLVVDEYGRIRGKWGDEFGNNNPIWIEIGMGKGKFMLEMAKKHPDVDFVGIEKYSSVLVRAIERCKENPPENLRFLRMDAENIADVFESGEVDHIFLNFSDPWPKDKHAKRRLTSENFLSKYEKILSSGGILEFKTDNDELFKFSLEEILSFGWTITENTWDLYAKETLGEDNVMTEYEEKFVLLGHPIHKLTAVRQSLEN